MCRQTERSALPSRLWSSRSCGVSQQNHHTHAQTNESLLPSDFSIPFFLSLIFVFVFSLHLHHYYRHIRHASSSPPSPPLSLVPFLFLVVVIVLLLSLSLSTIHLFELFLSSLSTTPHACCCCCGTYSCCCCSSVKTETFLSPICFFPLLLLLPFSAAILFFSLQF